MLSDVSAYCPLCGSEVELLITRSVEGAVYELWCWRDGWQRYFDYPEDVRRFATEHTWLRQYEVLAALME